MAEKSVSRAAFRLFSCILLASMFFSSVGAGTMNARAQEDESASAENAPGEGEAHTPAVVLIGLQPGIDLRPGDGPGRPFETNSEDLDGALNALRIVRLNQLFADPRGNAERLADSGAVDLSRVFRLHLPASVDVQEAVDVLTANPAVEFAEPDFVAEVAQETVTEPNDPRYPEQWALPAIGAPEAWAAMPPDAPIVTVAVIDSGICAEHPDLAGRIEAGWDFVQSDAVPQDDFGHGCSVTGIIAANTDNSVGMAGVAPNAQVMPLRVLNSSGSGSYSDVAAAIVVAADNGAQVINLSLGGSSPSATLETAVNYAIGKGVIVVAAAGNSGIEGALYPAAYPDVVAVGSVDQDLQHSSFSNYGPQIDIWAPGRDILSTKWDGTYALVSGTSFAAPYVAGAEAVGMMMSRPLALGGASLRMPWTESQLTPTPEGVSGTPSPSGAPGAITIDFETIVDVPTELRAAVLSAAQRDAALMPTGHDRFTVSAFRVAGVWTAFTLVPTSVVDSAWEAGADPAQVVFGLGHLDSSAVWQAYLEQAASFDAVQSMVPREFRDYSAPMTSQADETRSVFLFPWPRGTSWSKTWGWHDGAIDFAGGSEVLAAASGTLRVMCDDGEQIAIQIENSNGTTQYLHLDADSLDRYLVDQFVRRGRRIGSLYNGNAGERWVDGKHYQYWTACGNGTATHLHFGAPSSISIDGRAINTVATSSNGTTFLSTNTQLDRHAIVACFDANFRGTCERFSSTDEDLTNNAVGNDAISSYFVPAEWGVKLWEHTFAQGRGACLPRPPVAYDMGIYDLEDLLVFENCGYGGTTGTRANEDISAVEITQNGATACSADLEAQCYVPPSDPPPSDPPTNPGDPPAEPTGDWEAKYWDDSTHWWNNNHYDGVRCSESIGGGLDKNYGSGAPCGGMDGNDWVAEYNATINFPSGNYVFHIDHDDGLKMWVGQYNNIADYGGSGSQWTCPARYLSGNVPIKVILREDGGDASVRVTWQTDASACAPAKADLTPYNRDGASQPVVGSLTSGNRNQNTLVAGQKAYFDWGYKNVGGTNAGPHHVKLSINGQQFIDYPFNGLGAGSLGGWDDWEITYPNSGCYAVALAVDTGSQVDESNENNNAWSGTMCWDPPPLPDLQPRGSGDDNRAVHIRNAGTSVGAPQGAVISGQTTYLDWEYINTGTAAAGAHRVIVEIDGTEYVNYSSSGLAAGAVYGQNSVALPISIAPGYHRVKLRVDPHSQVLESSEVNNLWLRTILWRAPMVKALDNFTTDENGTSASLESSTAADGQVTAEAVKTSFAYGDAIQLHMLVDNDFATDQQVTREYEVTTPYGKKVPELSYTGFGPTGPDIREWWITRTIPDRLSRALNTYTMTGYTFTARVTHNGKTTKHSTVFSVTGPPAVEAADVFLTDSQGNASALSAEPQQSRRSDAQARSILTLLPGDGIRLYIDTANDVADQATAAFAWMVIDPLGRHVTELEWSGDLNSYYGGSWWSLPRNIPAHAITGDYVFTGSITYGGRTTYQSQVFHVTGGGGPANDNIGSPAVISAAPYNHQMDTWAATVAAADPTPSCGSGKNSNSVWYRYTPPTNGLLEVNTWGSGYDTVIGLWRGSPSALIEVACNDDAYGYVDAWLEGTPVTGGTTYYIEVMDYGNPGGGDLALLVDFASPVGNDDIGAPFVIGSLPFAETRDTRGATQAAGDPALTTCNRLPGAASVWYRFNAPLDGTLELNTRGSDYDTMLAAWTGSPGNLVPAGCNDDIGYVNGAWNPDSVLSVPVTAGSLYYVEISTYAGMIDTSGASAQEVVEKPQSPNTSSLEGDPEQLKGDLDEQQASVQGLQQDLPQDVAALFKGGTASLQASFRTVAMPHPWPATQTCRRPQVGVDLAISAPMRTASGSFNASKVTLKLDGVTVTGQAQTRVGMTSPASWATILYQPTADLTLGTHQVQFTYPGVSGPLTATWNFSSANITCGTTLTMGAAEPTASMEATQAQSGSREFTSAAAPDDSVSVEPAQAELAVPSVSSAAMPASDPAQLAQPQVAPSAAAAPQPFPPRVQTPTQPLRGAPHPGLYYLLLSRPR
jgi:hypothetical protein